MKNKDGLVTIFLFFMLAIFAETVSAYGAEADKSECKKPKFRKFMPAHMSEVAPGTEISFHVTHVVEPSSIKVTAKKIPVEIVVEDRNSFYNVKGRLPESLQGTYARISVKAGAAPSCDEQDGWLLKILDNENRAEKPVENTTKEETSKEETSKNETAKSSAD